MNDKPHEADMTHHIKTITAKTLKADSFGFTGDLIGGAALMVALVVGLHLPGLF